MTIIVATRDRMVSDSRLTVGESHYEVGKIFRLPDGGLLATAGDGKLTYPFERAFMRGEEPEAIDASEDEEFEGAILHPDGKLVFYGQNYSPYEVGNPYVVIGSGQAAGAALSWLKHGAGPEEAVTKAIEVDNSCGGRIVTILLHEPAKPKRVRKAAK